MSELSNPFFHWLKSEYCFFQDFFPDSSKSPVEIPTLIFFPKGIFSNFLNSVNFSAANARKGLR